MSKSTARRQSMAQPDEARAVTLAEARAMPGLLGVIAPAMLAAHGLYGYTDTANGQDRKVLLTLKRAER